MAYGTIIYVCTGTDESFNTFSGDGIDDLQDMLRDAHSTEEAWSDFLETFVDDPDVIKRFKNPSPR